MSIVHHDSARGPQEAVHEEPVFRRLSHLTPDPASSNLADPNPDTIPTSHDSTVTTPSHMLTILFAVYNLFMLAVDFRGLAVLGRDRNIANAAKACLGVALVNLAMAVVFGGLLMGSVFLAFRLLTYAVFVHLPIMLAGSAVLLRRPRRKTAIALVVAAVLIAAVGVDALLIEPTRLEVSHLRLATNKVDRPVRIVVLADLQTDVFGAYEKMVFQRVLAEKPDLVLLAGDYLHAHPKTCRRLIPPIRAYLKEIEFSAPAGAFAVRGNIDSDDWPEIFAELPITTAQETRSFQLPGLQLTCLSMRDSFNRSLAVRNLAPERFHVVLGHSPSFALGRVEGDLLLSGHTHGGQVRLPILGPIITLSAVPRSWAADLTDLPSGGQLYVSRGIGMERGPAPRIRFLCRPELAVIDLVPE